MSNNQISQDLKDDLAIIIMKLGENNTVIIPKSFVDSIAGKNYELITVVDFEKECVIYKVIIEE